MTRRYSSAQRQQGVTLIELMVGIVLGLMVVGVATVALMSARGLSGTTTEASAMQQQAAYAFSVIGRQVRQAGSVELNLNPNLTFASNTSNVRALEPVAFDAPDPQGLRPPFKRIDNTLTEATATAFKVGYQNYTENIKPGSGLITESQLYDCLGQNPGKSDPAAHPVVFSKFSRKADTNELVCTGMGNGGTQAIIENVTDLQIRYALQPRGTSSMQYISDPEDIEDWSRVYAVEVCLELTGKERIGGVDTATYKNCKGENTSYGNRMKMVFRSTYQLRSQGQAS